MRRFYSFVTVCFLLTALISNDIYAQKKSRRIIKADNAFALEEYSKAAELYKKAYTKTKDKGLKAEIIFKQAECYRLSGQIKRAESYYKRAIKVKYPDVIVYLRYADVLRMQEDYQEAILQYQKYIELNPDDVNGEMGLKSCDFALQWKDVPTRYNLELLPIVNSRYSDYSPAFGNSEYTELYFTSSRTGGVTDKIDDRTGEPFSDVYLSRMNKKGIWSSPTIVAAPINTEGNEGSVFINNRGTTMYITQCKVEKKKSLGCGIYVSNRKGKVWSDPKILQIKIDSNTTIGHPTLSQDESTMIFAADMQGGYGGKDLWMVKKEKRSNWSDPINLGPLVNTPGDEMFPFLHIDGTIYFASTGHIGMGGFDIYKTSQDENGAYILPVNLKSPVNSAADDFGMIVEEDGERGYLTSNRRGGKGGDDIYQFELPPLEISVKGIVTESKNGSILTNKKVQLLGSDGSAKEVVTDNTGSYSFELDPLTSYQIIIDTEGYLKKIVSETTFGLEFNKVFEINIALDPVKKEIILPKVEWDFAKWELRPESIIDLDVLAEALLDNDNVVIKIKSHTDELGTDKSNQALSQKRGQTCVDYLISMGVDPGQLVAVGVGESEPYVIKEKDGRFNVGDVLTSSYIRKIRFKKNKEKAHQYNRRTSFEVFREDYVPDDNAAEQNK
tara:strand:+ start:4937 stop:6946 length:2010 start_codon:yes stop_codon:yes gene_type:complete